MNVNCRLKTGKFRLFALTAFLAISLVGCVSSKAYTRGSHAEVAQDYDTALAEYKIALGKDPENIEYKLRYERAVYNAAFQHFESGRRAIEKQDYDTAKMEFTRVLQIDPTHELAQVELNKVNDILTAKSRNQPEPELQIDRLRDVTQTDTNLASQLDVKITGPIDLHMTQDFKVVFETLAEFAGINVIFDPDVRSSRVPIDLNKVNIFEALDVLALETRTFWKVINRTTILVAPDNQTKRRDYEDLIFKTIYLSNSVTSTEVTQAITALRTLLNMRYLAQIDAVNAIMMRDTPDRVAIAEKIIKDLDKSKAEVLVDATVLEVNVSTLRQLGILPPQGTTVTAFGGSAGSASSTGGNAFPLNQLPKSTSAFSLTIPPATAQFLATSSNAKLLQNPEVRATDGQLASIRVGSQVPIASGSFQPAFVGATGTPVVNFQYIDVGVNLDITSHVLLNREISMKVQVQIRALDGADNVGGVEQPVLTNRQVTHEIRLVEGETNILGGIITEDDQTSLNGIPGLLNIPILKYFFSQEQKTRDKTEIIIMLTPHILRMPNIEEANMRGINTGSESLPRLHLSTLLNDGAASSPAPGTPAPTTGSAPAQAAPAPPTPQAPAAAATRPTQPVRITNSTVAFSPSLINLPPTGAATVNIVGTGTDFYAIDLTLQYEPGAFNIRDIREGGFLSRDRQIVSLVKREETETGVVHISLELPPGGAPVSGTGNLLTLVLERIPRQGNSTLRMTEFQVRDAQQNVSDGKTAEVTVLAP